MRVKPNHPLAELLAQLLFSIETVDAREQRRMVNHACREAVKWHKNQVERLLKKLGTGWIVEQCRECDVFNWLFDGDPTDETRPDIEGFLCYNCKLAHPLMLDEPGDIEGYEIGLEDPE